MRTRRAIVRDHRPHGPDPWDRPLTADQVPEHRHLACGLYAICLDVAVRRQWPCFTCRACSLWPGTPARARTGEPAVVLPLPRAAQR